MQEDVHVPKTTALTTTTTTTLSFRRDAQCSSTEPAEVPQV